MTAALRDLFRLPLMEMLNPKHPLLKLADVIDWPTIERSFGVHFASSRGRLDAHAAEEER